MPNSSGVLIDLMIVAALVALVAVEVNLIVVLFDILQAERFVPSLREHIKGDLATNGELQIKISQLLLKCLNKCGSDLSSLIVFLKIVSLIFGAVATNWRNVHHPIPVLQESTTIKIIIVSFQNNQKFKLSSS